MKQKVNPDPVDLGSILGAFGYPSSQLIRHGMYNGMWRVHITGFLTDAERDELINAITLAQKRRLI